MNVLTNADRIRAMTDEELAEHLTRVNEFDFGEVFCKNLSECEELLDTEDGVPDSKCFGCMLDWLRKPVEGKR